MKKLTGLILGVTFAAAAPIASAFPDPLHLMPEVGGAETTFNVKADDRGIGGQPAGNEFWYAGTSGVPSN